MSLPNRICQSRPVRGEEAFVYGFKARAKQHHCLGYATFSVEVEELARLRKAYSRAIAPITNLPLYVKATALALARHPEANAILFRGWFGGRRIVRFERVDVNLPFTRMLNGRPLTFIGTIRNAAAKSLADIQHEISRLTRGDTAETPALARVAWFKDKPLWLARLIHWRMAGSPEFYVRNVGTCGLTLGDENAHEWVFPIAPTSVVFGLGGVVREPVVRGDEIAVARVLKASLMVDNYVVPGLLGGKLIQEFKELLETGSFVREELAAVETAGVR